MFLKQEKNLSEVKLDEIPEMKECSRGNHHFRMEW